MDVGKLNGRTLYVGGAKGIDELAEEHGKQHDMEIHKVLNPQHHRSRFVTPITQQQMDEALPYVYKANEKLRRHLDSTILSYGYLQRNYWIVKSAQTIFAFGEFENRGFDKTVWKEERVGTCKWLWITETKPCMCTRKTVNNGTRPHGINTEAGTGNGTLGRASYLADPLT